MTVSLSLCVRLCAKYSDENVRWQWLLAEKKASVGKMAPKHIEATTYARVKENRWQKFDLFHQISCAWWCVMLVAVHFDAYRMEIVEAMDRHTHTYTLIGANYVSLATKNMMDWNLFLPFALSQSPALCARLCVCLWQGNGDWLNTEYW